MSKKARRPQYKDESPIKTSLSDVTPLLAEKWMERRADKQRKIDQKQVQKITTAILKGDWRVNGGTIVFDEEGFLVDGQHRLLAIIAAGKTVQALIVRGVDKSDLTFQTIDDSKARKVTDFMNCNYVNNVAAVCTLLISVQSGKWPLNHDKIPYVETLKVVKKWQDVIAPLVNAVNEGGRFVRQHSFCTFLLFYYAHIEPVKNPERLAAFFARLGDGIGLDRDDPVYQLRKRFLDQAATVKFDRQAGRAMIIKALHSYLDSKPMSVVRYEPMRESFPELRKRDTK